MNNQIWQKAFNQIFFFLFQDDGPTIHELAHDDVLHNEASQDSFHPAGFVSVDLANSSIIPNANNSVDPLTSTEYHVTLEDGDDAETGNFYFKIKLFNFVSVIFTKSRTQNIIIIIHISRC